MPRFPAIFVIVAILASPLAIVARGMFCDPSECTCMVVCPMHASQSRPMCGVASNAPRCGAHQGRHALDYGFIAPFAPAMLVLHAQLASPRIPSDSVLRYAQLAVDGISSVPFEPPRS